MATGVCGGGGSGGGSAIYHQARAIELDNLNTHEYLGEGYLAAGRIDLAEAQLDILEGLCGRVILAAAGESCAEPSDRAGGMASSR